MNSRLLTRSPRRRGRAALNRVTSSSPEFVSRSGRDWTRARTPRRSARFHRHHARFLASRESSLHPNFKQAIVESDGHDTLLSEIPDIAAGLVWPGAMSRSRRNRFIERWAGREWALRQRRVEAKAALQAARKGGDVQIGRGAG